MVTCTQQEIFQEMGSFLEKQEFDKHLVHTTRKKGITEKNVGVFFLETPTTTFRMIILSY